MSIRGGSCAKYCCIRGVMCEGSVAGLSHMTPRMQQYFAHEPPRTHWNMNNQSLQLSARHPLCNTSDALVPLPRSTRLPSTYGSWGYPPLGWTTLLLLRAWAGCWQRLWSRCRRVVESKSSRRRAQDQMECTPQMQWSRSAFGASARPGTVATPVSGVLARVAALLQ